MSNPQHPNPASGQFDPNAQAAQTSPAQNAPNPGQPVPSSGGRKPDFVAYNVEQGANGKGYFNKIGAAWAHKDGQGYEVNLDAVPVNGRVSLRAQREQRAQDYAREQAASQPNEQHVTPGYEPAQ
ncbi:MAG: hypothetical protein AAF515_16800 [Pseudomonadota bacterium]